MRYSTLRIRMSVQMEKELREICMENGTTVQQFFRDAMKWAMEHLHELSEWNEEHPNTPKDDEFSAEFIEEQLRTDWPYSVITQDEFVAHIEDEDFFAHYGNPVLIQCLDGQDLVCMGYEYYLRMLEERGQDTNAIRAEIAQEETKYKDEMPE